MGCRVGGEATVSVLAHLVPVALQNGLGRLRSDETDKKARVCGVMDELETCAATRSFPKQD